MPLLELKGFGVADATARVAGIDLTIEPGSMLAVVGRDGASTLLALAIAGLLPRGAATTGALSFAGKRVLYLDRNADAAAVVAGAELIVAVEPGRGRDPATQLALLQALQEASWTAAVIIFTADFRLALSMGLEVAVIAGGKVLVRAPASQIAELPQYDTVRHLVGGARLRTRTLMRPPIGEPILELAGVTKTYRRGLPRLGPPPVTVLAGVGFGVRQGEVVGLLGTEGAGKSTLLRLVAGLERPSGGQIARRPGLVGYVFSDPRRAFNPTLPVGMSLTEPLRVEQTLLMEEQADRLVEVVRAVGLEPDRLSLLPGSFGAADLQRLALARALAGRPNLLLMDDPTAALDPAETREFLVLLARVRADFGLTAIIASSEFDVLRSIVDRLLVLDGGRIVEGGKAAELFESPTQEATRRLVSARYPGLRPERPVADAVAVVASEAMPDPPLPEPTEVTAPSTGAGPVDFSAAAPPDSAAPPVGDGAAPDPVAEPMPAELPAEQPGALPASEPTPVAVEPTPEPVHTLSAKIVIAPVVLADPVIAPPTSTPAEPAADGPVEAPPNAAVDDPAASPANSGDARAEAFPDAAGTEIEPAGAASDVASVAGAGATAGTMPAATEPVMPEPDAAAESATAPAQFVPEPTAEPAAPSVDGADEAAEAGQREPAIDGAVDAAGRVDAADGEAGR